MGELKNGAIQTLDKIGRLPGIQRTYVLCPASGVSCDLAFTVAVKFLTCMSLSDRFDKVSAIKEDHISTAIDEMKEMGHNHQSEKGA